MFLPVIRTSNAARMDRAMVHAAARAYRSKPEITLTEIDRMHVANARFSGILTHTRYNSDWFRAGLEQSGIAPLHLVQGKSQNTRPVRQAPLAPVPLDQNMLEIIKAPRQSEFKLHAIKIT